MVREGNTDSQSERQLTPELTPELQTATHSGSTKYAFKTCPRFDPNYYLVWANDVHLAFEERDWEEYLLPPDPESAFTPDPRIMTRAKAFLMEAIPYEHKVSMTKLTSAAAIFTSLEEQYGSATREDEFRLETQLMLMRKLATDTVDEHIAKFKTLIATTMAQQDENRRYKNDKRNQLFLATLEYSEIEDENWERFIPSLGNTWKDMTPESLFATTRTYYLAHILPKKKKTTSTTTTDSVEARVQRTDANPHGNNTNSSGNRGGRSQSRGRGGKFNNFGNRSNSGNNSGNNYGNNSNNYGNNSGNYGNNSGNNYGNSRSSNYGNNQHHSNDKPREKYDPTKYCHIHNAPGHSTETCRAKFRD